MYKFVCVLVLTGVLAYGAYISPEYTPELLQKCQTLSGVKIDTISADMELSRDSICLNVCLNEAHGFAGVEWNADGSINVNDTIEKIREFYLETSEEIAPKEMEARMSVVEHGIEVTKNCSDTEAFSHYCDKAFESVSCIFRLLGPK